MQDVESPGESQLTWLRRGGRGWIVGEERRRGEEEERREALLCWCMRVFRVGCLLS